MSQVRWKYTGQQMWWEEEQEEQLQSLQMPCPIPAPGHSHLSCACRSQLLNLNQPESSFETTAKPLGYVCVCQGRKGTHPHSSLQLLSQSWTWGAALAPTRQGLHSPFAAETSTAAAPRGLD